ncbi:g6776 [Coccomyxa elongata]
MVGMKSRCTHPGCKTWAYFNNQGEQRGYFCSAHKEPGMVDVVNKLCEHPNCNKHPNFNHPGATHAQFCSQHKEPGMVNVNIRDRQCAVQLCSKYPSCNFPGQTDGLYCGKHKEEGMVNVTSRHCAYPGCIKQPNFHHPGNTRGMFCCAHKSEGMVNVVSKPCQHPGCTKQPSFNFPGQSQGLYCSPHKQPGMVNVKQKHCGADGCTNRPSFNFPGTNSGIFCSAHKLENMVDVRNKHCAHPDCNKCPSFNYPGKTPGVYCGLHKLAGMVDVKHKRDRSNLSSGNLQQQAAAAQQPSQEMPIDYNAQAAAQKQGESQMAAQQGGYSGAEADMTAAEAVAAALNMSADGSALGLPAHVDHLGQPVADGYMAAGHDASTQQEAYAMHLNQEQAAAAAGYEQVAYEHQSGLTHEQMAAAAAHAAYGTGPPAAYDQAAYDAAMQAGPYDPNGYAQAHDHVEGYEQAGAMPDQVAQGLYGQSHHAGYGHEAAVNSQQQQQQPQHGSYTAQIAGDGEPEKRQRVE